MSNIFLAQCRVERRELHPFGERRHIDDGRKPGAWNAIPGLVAGDEK